MVAEAVAGGFGAIYPVLKAMEESGRIRRGYFVAGLGATQFALPGAVDLLRAPRDLTDDPAAGVVSSVPLPLILDATDPANPYGATLAWPARATETGRGPTRSAGATTFMVNGALTAFLARGNRHLLTWLPEAEPELSRAAQAVARALLDRARTRDDESTDAPAHGMPGMLIEEIDGRPPADHPIALYLVKAGFVRGALGFHAPTAREPVPTRAADSIAPAPAERSDAVRRSIKARRRVPVSSPFAFLKHERTTETGDE